MDKYLINLPEPAPTRSFPIYFQDGQVVYPQFAYPLRKEIIPIWLAALIVFIVPFFFFTLFQIRRRSLDDWLTTNLGLLRSEILRMFRKYNRYSYAIQV